MGKGKGLEVRGVEGGGEGPGPFSTIPPAQGKGGDTCFYGRGACKAMKLGAG